MGPIVPGGHCRTLPGLSITAKCLSPRVRDLRLSDVICESAASKRSCRRPKLTYLSGVTPLLTTVRKTVIVRTVIVHGGLKRMAKIAFRLVSPATENRTVAPAMPIRRPNSELRTREHLTPSEVDALIEAAKKNRYGHRDATMILMAYRHGFRPSELVDVRWDQVDFAGSRLHVRRAKRGTPATHPLQGDTMRALRRLRKEAPHAEFVFVSERGSPFSPAGFAKMIERAGKEAGFRFKAHPHMQDAGRLADQSRQPRAPLE
jgi:integrase